MINDVLPTQTKEDRLFELQEKRQALELTNQILSYEDYANQFLALATEFLEIDALSNYERCMQKYKFYIAMAAQ